MFFMKNTPEDFLSELKISLDRLRQEIDRIESAISVFQEQSVAVKDSVEVIAERDEPSLQGEAEAQRAAPAVMDVLAEKEAWRKDMPGSPVKDIRSAISLNDRALFIRSLFRGDPMLFSNTVTRINIMESLDEVLACLRDEFPEWNMDSDVVYRFMMAVRRKIR